MNGILDSDQSSSGLSYKLKNSLSVQAYWARFLGMMGLITNSLFLLVLIFAGSFIFSMLSGGLGAQTEDMPPGFAGGSTFLFIFYGLMIAFSLFISYLLYNFGRKTLKGLKNGNDSDIETGSENLATLFKIGGIIASIFVVIYILIIIFMVIGGGLAYLNR